MACERIVAVALVTHRDLIALGPSFDRAWPVDQAPCFEELLQAIDEAEPLDGMVTSAGVLRPPG